MITCQEAVNQLWEYLDGAVTAADRDAIEEHLSFCRLCCGEVDFAHELRGFLAASADEQLPDDVRDRLLAHLDKLERTS